MNKSQNLIKSLFLFGGTAILIISFTSNYLNKQEKILAWYPIKRVEAKCDKNIYELFQMKHTQTRQSKLFFIDIQSKQEFTPLSSCKFLTIDFYNKWNGINESRNNIQIQNTIITEKRASHKTTSLTKLHQQIERVTLMPYKEEH